MLDVPYSQFRDLVLAAVDPRCILQPLRDTIARLRDRAPPPSSPLDSTPAVLAAAIVGFACSLCASCRVYEYVCGHLSLDS